MSGEARILRVPIGGEVPEARAIKRIIDKMLEMFSNRMGPIEKTIAASYFKKIKAGLSNPDPQTRNELYKALEEIDTIIKEEVNM